MVTFTQPNAANYNDDEAQTWKPKADSPQSLVGTVVDRKTITRDDESDVELIKLEAKDGQLWNVWASPKMLRDAVREDDPQPGDTWGVEYQGSKPIGAGRNMDLYGSFHRSKNAADRPSDAAKPAPKMASGPKDSEYVDDDDPF